MKIQVLIDNLKSAGESCEVLQPEWGLSAFIEFNGKKIYAMLGGFHLYRTSDSQVRAFAERLRKLDVQKIYTGHCTGDHAYEILHEVLGDRAQQMYTGMEIEV